MDGIATLVAQQAIAQQDATLSLMKQSAQADAAMAKVVEETAQSIVAGERGAQVNMTA